MNRLLLVLLVHLFHHKIGHFSNSKLLEIKEMILEHFSILGRQEM